MKKGERIAVFLLAFLFLASIISFLIFSDSFQGIIGGIIKLQSTMPPQNLASPDSQNTPLANSQESEISALALSINLKQLPYGLISYYNFDGSFNDVLGRNNAVCSRCPPFVNGRVNNAVYLSYWLNSSGYYNYNDLYAPSTSGRFSFPSGNQSRTLSTWVKLNNDPNNNYRQKIFGYGLTNRENDSFYLIFNRGRLCFRDLNENDAPCSKVAMNFGEWYFLTVSYDGNMIRLYINAKEVGNSLRIMNTNSSGALVFGGWGEWGGGFNGSIDEFMIWSRNLSSDEISKVYNLTGAGGRCIPTGCFGKKCMIDPECNVSCGSCPMDMSCDSSLDECYYPCVNNANCDNLWMVLPSGLTALVPYCVNGKCKGCRTGNNSDCYDIPANSDSPVCNSSNFCIAKECSSLGECNFAASGTPWACDQSEKKCMRAECLLDSHCGGSEKHCCTYPGDPIGRNSCEESAYYC